jgi:S-DNA-T family DNA segregation ATPase FtsK/SpoIIIE
MAKTIYKENTFRNEPEKPQESSIFLKKLGEFLRDEKFQLSLGIFLIVTSFALLIAFFSYLFTGKADQSVVETVFSTSIRESGAEVENWLGMLGAVLAHIFVFKWFGLGAFLLVPLIFLIGYKLTFKDELMPFMPTLQFTGFTILWSSLLMSSLFTRESDIGFWGGGLGFTITEVLRGIIGSFGTFLLVMFALVLFLIYFVKLSFKTTFNPKDNPIFNTLSQKFTSLKDKFTEKTPSFSFGKSPKTNKEELDDDTFDVNDLPDFNDVKNNTKNPLNKTTITTPTPNKNNFTKNKENIDDFEEKAENEKTDLGKTKLPKSGITRPKNPKVELEIDPATPIDFSKNNKNVSNKKEIEEECEDETFLKGVQAKIKFSDKEKQDLEEENSFIFENKTDEKQPKENIDFNFPNFNKEKDFIPKKEIPTIINEEVKEEPIFKTNSDASAMNLYDPTEILSLYRKPEPELLNEPPAIKRQVSNEELEANKDKIVETLSNYGIGISQIKATIGPTVTLYEIIPEAGVRISKIKSLEDDIALSLAALGIRIIAPIPGKGTIGIEVPNKKREMVAMRSILESDVFKNSDKTLPLVLGKSITNEILVADLAKMPHLLMAGATGQGKSVGLNVFLTSLIYKKHPAELKFVLVDPKKVELTLFNKIEKHFLAKLPGDDEAIITDTTKVIHTLTALCMEMDNRYNLLKEAACRNIQEYNTKFKQRRLNPNKGHKFLPYIVLVIDELADLMMVAGKEVEQPIARLAQLARAIGIHLIVATQRPSVNVITGIIKANFPARLSFKVTSKIDSRTILDAGGAEQLVGMGDFLFSMGSDTFRLQCPFLDTPEVERVCDFISKQQGFSTPYELPEVETNNNSQTGDGLEASEKDVLFEEAARIVVIHQQGSTSLLQRRLKLGYNRAGRLIDQLEKAGIVGPFEGSKAREVLVTDEYALERILNSM